MIAIYALAFFGAVAAVTFGLFFASVLRDRVRERRARAALRRAFEARPKGRIVKVGTIVRDCLGREHPWGFEIDCEGRVPAATLGPDGEFVAGGYTREELLEMARRPAEFEP